MTASPFSRFTPDLALARAVRARPRGAWRPSWGRIAALGFSFSVWGLIGWAAATLFGALS